MASGAQTQFWYNFTTIKRNAIYINRYHALVEKKDRRLNMFAAIASSSSIGAWVIWKDAWPVWTTIIAASQVLAAVKPYLPFKAQLHALSMLGPELDGLALAAEEEWFAVSHGRLTEEEIHKQTMTLKKKVQAAQNKGFKGMSLPDHDKLLGIAEREALDYMGTIAGDEDGQTEATEPANDDQEGSGAASDPDGRADAKSLPAQGAQLAQEIGEIDGWQTALQERDPHQHQ